MKQTVQDFFKRFPEEETCLSHLFNTRFGQGHSCSKCGKSAKWYRIKAERAYSCQWCGHHSHDVANATENLAEIANQLTHLKATLSRDAPSVIS